MTDAELIRARATVARILHEVNVNVVWAACPCQAGVGPAELVIRIALTTPASEPASLGFSYIDVDRKAGTLSTVFADRVRALATRSGVDVGELTGRAMAHEIVHLLLGTRAHARHGLMRAEWTTIDLARNRPWDWALSRDEGASLRRAIARRLRIAEEPAAVVAGVGAEDAGVSAP